MTAGDNLKEYFIEKIWEMLPLVHRQEDEAIAAEQFKQQYQGEKIPPGPLRALVETIAEHAAHLRRSQDRLWEDGFIEWCGSWAVPYIGDLVGTRLVSALNPRGRRADVAKTIYYRRHKGTLRILEELIHDITEWEGTIIENFRRLARTRHGLDPHPENFNGPLSGTPPGGTARLNGTGNELAGLRHSAFDEFYYTPDMRRHKGFQGRYSIPKLAFHIYRLQAYRITDAVPARILDDGVYSFDPSGRTVPLFKPRNRAQDPSFNLLMEKPEQSDNWEFWLLATEEEMPSRLRCPLLSGILTRIKNGKMAAEELARYFWIEPAEEEFDPKKVAAGALANRNQIKDRKTVLVDAVQGCFAFHPENPRTPARVHYYYGFSGPVGAGSYDRGEWLRTCETCECFSGGAAKEISGDSMDLTEVADKQIIRIPDNGTYKIVGDIKNIKNLMIHADNQKRPYLKLNSDWTLSASDQTNAILVLDGIWAGTGNNPSRDIILDGNFERVVISHTTFDPGNYDNDGACTHPFIRLVVKGFIEHLFIKESIMGPVHVDNKGVVETITIENSIIQAHSASPHKQALKCKTGKVMINASTVWGDLEVRCFEAGDSILLGSISIADKQRSCVRFTASYNRGELAKAYECYEITASDQLFVSTRFGHPCYARLSEPAPPEIRQGAEDRLEMGVFNFLRDPVKLESLMAKVDEYMPFGLIPLYIFEGEEDG